MSDALTTLRTCAFCPNTCRPSHPAGAAEQMESQTPSALALIALAHLDGRLREGSGALHVLSRRGAALDSIGHCTYGLDINAALDSALGA
jgi:hypothetical protein